MNSEGWALQNFDIGDAAAAAAAMPACCTPLIFLRQILIAFLND